MHELIKVLFIVMLIVFVLVLALLFLSGRPGHGLNGHMEIPEEFDPRALLRGHKEEDAEASDFFDHIEELRRDFA